MKPRCSKQIRSRMPSHKKLLKLARRLADRRNYSPSFLALKKRLEEAAERHDYSDRDLPEELHRSFDRLNLQLLFYARLGRLPDLDNPQTFNEKSQWLKLNLRVPGMAAMSDKLEVRRYLEDRGLGQYLNQLYAACRTEGEFRDIFDSLPNQFAAKLSHWSGANMIVQDKSNFDWDEFGTMCTRLGENYYFMRNQYRIGAHKVKLRKGEWNYAHQTPTIVVEKLLTSSVPSLRDYKFFCFNGDPEFVQVDVDRFTNHRRCFYDTDWNKQPFTSRYPCYEGAIERPSGLAEMLDVARKLSAGFPFLRVDLYQPNDDEIIFGELTFYHGSGTERFYPRQWDDKLGKLLDIRAAE